MYYMWYDDYIVTYCSAISIRRFEYWRNDTLQEASIRLWNVFAFKTFQADVKMLFLTLITLFLFSEFSLTDWWLKTIFTAIIHPHRCFHFTWLDLCSTLCGRVRTVPDWQLPSVSCYGFVAPVRAGQRAELLQTFWLIKAGEAQVELITPMTAVLCYVGETDPSARVKCMLRLIPKGKKPLLMLSYIHMLVVPWKVKMSAGTRVSYCLSLHPTFLHPTSLKSINLDRWVHESD